MIYTVTGPIKKEAMGITLSHEHFKWEYDECYANDMYYKKKYNEKDIKQSVEIILPLLNELSKYGCCTVVEASPPIGGQNLKLLKELSEKSNMHIIASTGWNMSKDVYEILSDNFVEQLAKRWISDFENGLDTIDGITIKPGYMKLLLETGTLNNVDKAMLKAAIITSKKTQMPIHCHILEAKMVYEVIELLEQENADFSKFLWAHGDYEGHMETIQYALDKGLWVGFDIVRVGTYEKHVQLLKAVIALGQTDQIILSRDYEMYAESQKNNSQVCYSFFSDFIPYCETQGISKSFILDMMTENAANYYDIQKTL